MVTVCFPLLFASLTGRSGPGFAIRLSLSSPNLEVRQHRAALLGKTGLVEAVGRLAVEQGGRRQHLVHRDHARAADAHHQDVALVDTVGLRQVVADVLDCHRGLGGDLPRRHHLDERRAVAVEAGEVFIARRLVNLGLAAELGLDGLHAQAARLLAAVAAALADRLVDEHSRVGLGHLAALAVAPQLGRTRLVIDQDRAALDLAQHALRLVHAVAVPDVGAGSELGIGGVLGGVVGDHHHLGHALGVHRAGQLGHGHAAVDVLAARHGDRAVVEDLVGDVGAGGHGLAQRQRAGVVVGAVADVLKPVLHRHERRCADPLAAFAAHLSRAADVAGGRHGRHAVAADAAACLGALRHPGGAVVRAARAEPRRAAGGLLALGSGDRQRDRDALGHSRPDAFGTEPVHQERPDLACDQVGVHLTVAREPEAAVLIALAEHDGRAGHAVEVLLHERLDDRALLFHSDDHIEPIGELAQAGGLERPHYGWLPDADASALQLDVVESHAVERLAQVVIGLACGHEADPGVAGGNGLAIELVGRHELVDCDHAALVDLEFHAHRVRAEQGVLLGVRPGLALPFEFGTRDRDTARANLHGRVAVGHVGDDLERRPESAVAGQLVAPAAVVDDLLDRAGIQDRRLEVDEHGLGLRRQRGRLRSGVVAGHEQHATLGVDATDVRMFDGVSRPVDPRRLAVPHAEHTVVAALEVAVRELASPHDRGAQILVEAGLEDDVVLLELGGIGRHQRVDAAQRRPAVARHHGRVVQPVTAICPELIQQHAQQRLHARHGHIAFHAVEAILELEVGECHRIPLMSRGGGCNGHLRGYPSAQSAAREVGALSAWAADRDGAA